MNTKGMKFLAVLAVLAMAFAAFAVVAPAETNDADEPAATELANLRAALGVTETEETIGTTTYKVFKLSADRPITETITIQHNDVIIDFNGYTVSEVFTNASNNVPMLSISTKSVILRDTSVNADGGFTATLTADETTKTNNKAYGVMIAVASGDLTIKSGSYDLSYQNAGYMIANTNGAVTIDGGTFHGATKYFYKFDSTDGTAKDNTYKNAASMICNGTADGTAATLTINGGIFTGGMNVVKNSKSSTAEINGGSFSNTLKSVVFNYGTMSIKGGSFVGSNGCAVLMTGKDDATLGSLAITGGTFTPSVGQTVIESMRAWEGQILALGTVSVANVENVDITLYAYQEVNRRAETPSTPVAPVASAFDKAISISGSGVKVYIPQYLQNSTVANLIDTSGVSITFGAGVTVINNGSIAQTASISNAGTIVNKNVMKVAGTAITNTGTIINDATLSLEADATLGGTIVNNKTFDAKNNLTLSAGATYTGNITVTSAKKVTLTANSTAGAAFDGTIYVGSAETAVIKLRALGTATTDDIVLTAGSLTIKGCVDGSYAGSKIIGKSSAAANSTIIDATSGLKVDKGSLTFGGPIDVQGDITLGATTATTVDIQEDATLTIADSKKIDVKAGSILGIDGTVKSASIGANAGTIANAGTVKASSGSTISLEVTGNQPIDDDGMSEITVTGESSIGVTEFPANQTVIVTGSWTLVSGTTLENGARVIVNGKLIVPAGTSLTIKANATLTIASDAEFIVYGALYIEDAVTVGENNFPAGSLNITNGLMDVYGTVSDDGNVTVAESKTVILEEGSSFTIEDKGTLTTGDSAEFIVSEGAVFKVLGVFGGSEIQNYGTIIINSDVGATSASTIYQMGKGATVYVQEYTINSDNYDTASITISDESLILYTYRSDRLDNYVTRDDYRNAVVLSMDLKSSGTSVDSSDYDVVFTGLVVVSSVTSESTNDGNNIHAGVYNKTLYKKWMDVSGDAFVSYVYVGNGTDEATYAPVATITLQDNLFTNESKSGSYTVTDALTIEDYVTVITQGSLSVTGTITTSSNYATLSNTGKITVGVDGAIYSAAKVVNNESNMNAAKVVTNTVLITGGSMRIYAYIHIDAAIAFVNSNDDVNEIVILGTQKLISSATLEAGNTIVDNGKLYIGEKTTSTGVVLTVEKGAVVKGTTATPIEVYGTLYAEDKTDVRVSVSSSVYSEQLDDSGRAVRNGWAKWTNISVAIETAQSGDTVALKQTSTLGSNLTVPSGVELLIPSGVTLKIDDGVTLTVNGVVRMDGGSILAQTGFDIVAQKINNTFYASSIVVNGAILSKNNLAYDNGNTDAASANYTPGQQLSAGAPIAGAYYEIRNYKVVSSLQVALDNVDSIRSQAITVYGEVNGGDLTFIATDYCDTLVIDKDSYYTQKDNVATTTKNLYNKLTVDSLILVNGAELSLPYDADGATTFSGAVEIGDAAIALNGVTPGANTTIVANSKGIMTVSGTVKILDKNDVIEILSGKVYSDGLTVNQATYGANAGTSNYTYTTYVIIDEGATLQADGATALVSVQNYGAIVVPSGKTMAINNITSYGSITVDPTTTTKAPGSLTLGGKIAKNGGGHVYPASYIGMSSLLIGDAATVSGPVKVTANETMIYVSSAASISDEFAEVLSDMEYTAFVVESAEWFTVYTNNGQTVSVTYTGVENSDLKTWNDIYGYVAYTKQTAAAITVGAYSALYAVLDFNLYAVTVVTDAGVKSVAIDGIELYNEWGTNIFTIGTDEDPLTPLKAGTHTVTYTLKDGYEGTPALCTEFGNILKDYKFAVSGTDADDLEITLQLTGTEKYVPDPVTPEEKSEWTITTILLVILVILIAVMAVIVALRLNRS